MTNTRIIKRSGLWARTFFKGEGELRRVTPQKPSKAIARLRKPPVLPNVCGSYHERLFKGGGAMPGCHECFPGHAAEAFQSFRQAPKPTVPDSLCESHFETGLILIHFGGQAHIFNEAFLGVFGYF